MMSFYSQYFSLAYSLPTKDCNQKEEPGSVSISSRISDSDPPKVVDDLRGCAGTPLKIHFKNFFDTIPRSAKDQFIEGGHAIKKKV